MIPEAENPQESKSVCPGKHARTAQADLGLRRVHTVGFLAGRLIHYTTVHLYNGTDIFGNETVVALFYYITHTM